MNIHPLLLAVIIAGLSSLNSLATTYYVNVNGLNPTPPYTTWNTASTDIQSAVNLATNGDSVLVTNGIYQMGGETANGYGLTNRLLIDKSILVQSVNGPAVTVIEGNPAPGSNAVRCVYMSNSPCLIGFTLTNGATLNFGDGINEQSGGGIFCESTNANIENCILANNSAANDGGGVYQGSLSNCWVTGNSCSGNTYGGGACLSVLTNCTIIGNFGGNGGGTYECTIGHSALIGNSGVAAGGAMACLLVSCGISNNSALFYEGGGADSSTLNNCTLSGNDSADGGGAYSCIMTNCTIIANYSSGAGGGADESTLVNCQLIGNTANSPGGGAADSTLIGGFVSANNGATNTGNFTGGGGLHNCVASYCTISSNTCWLGGAGANRSTLSYCVLNGNVSDNRGGGAWESTLTGCIVENNIGYAAGGGGVESCGLTSCLVVSNASNGSGGGADSCQMTNCTIVGNICLWTFLPNTTAGVISSSLLNCIVDFNQSGDYDASSTLNFCCSELLATNGVGNITNDPGFVNFAGGDFHLQADSPCINAGDNDFVSGATDLDGNPRIVGPTVDIGAYEYQSPTIDITVGPQSQTIVGGQPLIFIAVAVSPLLFSYQWQFDGTNIPGATNANYSISEVQSNYAGIYDVVISNGVVTATSSNALLTVVYPPPAIALQPTNLSVVAGANASFSVNATSYYAMSFQWQMNGTNLTDGGKVSGSTNTTLTISGALDANDGAYQVMVSNDYSAVTSSVATLTVSDPVQIIGQPAGQTVLSGSSLSFTAIATGTALNYQWYFNSLPLTDGGNISGSKSPTLNIANIQTSNAGSYKVSVTNFLNAVTSSNAILTVYNPVQIAAQPGNLGIMAGNTASFAVTATGTAPGYQWYFNGAPLTDAGNVGGSASPTLTIANVQSGNSGSYMVAVTNLLSATNSLSAALTLAWMRFVNVSNITPEAPYTNWGTAAVNIQDAVNVSGLGDLIMVTNGVYQNGGETVNGYALTNRVGISQPVTVASVNGPAVTFINGYQMPGTTNGNSAIRCVYMTNNAVLAGFTLSGGATRNSGDPVHEESGGGVWCESRSSIISNCVINASMSTSWGGGAYQGTLVNCWVENNASGTGGGVNGSTMQNSVIAGNSASGGGGASSAILVNCTVTDNSASHGAGTQTSTQTNCIIYFNPPFPSPTATTNWSGGSFSYCCTWPLPAGSKNLTNDPMLLCLSQISLRSPCLGAGQAAATSGTDINGNPWANPPSIGCEEPYPGNMFGDLQLNIVASATNIARGYPIYFQAAFSGPIYSNAWSFGDGIVVSNEDYVSHSWSTTGSYAAVLTVYNDSYPTGDSFTNLVTVYQPNVEYVNIGNHTPVAPYDSWTKAATNIQSAINAASIDNLVLVSNGVYSAGSTAGASGILYRVAVNKRLTLQSVNGPGVTLINGGRQVACVYLTNNAVLIGFTLTNGIGSATNYGSGVSCQSTNSLVENCLLINNVESISASLYFGTAYSGTLTNCTITGTTGAGAVYSTLFNCSISNNTTYGTVFATLNNCFICTNNISGAYFSTLNNCIVTNNVNVGIYGGNAINCQLLNNIQRSGTTPGGGAYEAKLTNCLLAGNQTETYGGGASSSTLVNCTVVNNSAADAGGGVYNCVIDNCIVYYNTNSQVSYENYEGGTAMNSCTFPMFGSGFGNITNPPLFVNDSNNFRLQSSAPGINSGNNTFISSGSDLDGNPRIVGGTVDMGTYEYQTPASIISYAWLQQFGLPTDGSVDYADLDGTKFDVYQDWIAGLDPTNTASVLAIFPPAVSSSSAGVTVSWQSVAGITYDLQRSINLAAQPAFSTILTNIAGMAGSTSFTDTSATNSTPYFYRVGVQQ